MNHAAAAGIPGRRGRFPRLRGIGTRDSLCGIFAAGLEIMIFFDCSEIDHFAFSCQIVQDERARDSMRSLASKGMNK
jgi:hypothetical protein